MESATVAVTGVAGFLGQRLLARLEADPAVGRIVGLDVREPARRARHLEHHSVDIAGHDLKPLLEDVDVVVHLAAVVDPIVDEALTARVNVEGTRRVLDAAAAVGARKVVRVSTAAAYGAYAANPVPITEDAPLRPNPGFAPATQAAEVERLLLEWREDHPNVTVTTLRAAPILGAGAHHLWARLLVGRARPRVLGALPPVQVVHVDDAADALALCVREDLPGVFNVAADGWLAAEDAAALLPRPRVPALPGEALERGLRRAWGTGLLEVPPAVVPYLTHPWVVANDRLEQHGWRPAHTNEEALLETVDAWPAEPTWPRTAAIAGAAVTAGAVAGLTWRAVARRLRG